MHRTRITWLIPCFSVLLIAAEPVWRSEPMWNDKPIADWTQEDARQILANSPWVKTVVAGVTRRETEDERREGGNMGQPTGIGYDGVDDKRIDSTLPKRQGIRLTLRWESALPIRVAEIRAHESSPPTLSDDGYSIAVYGIPATYVNGDPASLGKPLKSLASLKREGKQDVKPSSVEVFELEDSVAVVYQFPLSAEIGKRDSIIEFTAMIGRLQVSQHFNLSEMLFHGKLEL